jgi:two-component system LytT family response regulator
MPLGDGFDVLASIPAIARPIVVFVTAFAQHAGHAFDAQALDYVLKPLEGARVSVAVGRVREQIRLRRLSRYDERLEELLTRRPAPTTVERSRVGPSRRIAVPSREGVRLLIEEQIDWIQAVGYYARLRIGHEFLLLRESLEALQERLDPVRFVRIHRSAIVNVERIVSIRGHTYGRAIVVLADGTKLILSRNRRAEVGPAIGWPVTRAEGRQRL